MKRHRNSLSAGNPNLVDISDENHPTKLAGRYDELYDIDWTDVFNNLTDRDQDDEMTINRMKNMFMSVHNKWRKLTTEDFVSFRKTVQKRFVMMKMQVA